MKLISILLLLLPSMLFSKEFKPDLYNDVLEECLLDLKKVSKDKKNVIAQSIELVKKSSIDPIQKEILTAKSFLALSRFERAHDIVNALLKKDKKNKDAWLIKGLAIRYSGDYQESLRCIKNSLNKSEKNEFKLYQLSIAYLFVGRPDLAIKHLEELLKINPDNIKAKMKLGGSWLNAGKPQKALEVYEEALIKNATNSLLLYNIGHISHHLNLNAKAIIHLKKALQINPHDWLAIQKLIQVYDKDSNFAEVKNYHLKLVALRNGQKTPNLKKKNFYVISKTKQYQWTIYAFYYFDKSKLLANQISFSVLETKNRAEKMKFNLVSQVQGKKTTYLLNIYYPNKTFKKYKQYEKIPPYEVIKKDILNCPLLAAPTKPTKKKK